MDRLRHTLVPAGRLQPRETGYCVHDLHWLRWRRDAACAATSSASACVAPQSEEMRRRPCATLNTAVLTIVYRRTGRTAAAALDLGQARAARRRAPAGAAQREAPEAPPAALEGAEQRCAVLLAGGRDGLFAAGTEGRSIRSIHRQQLPGGHGVHGILQELRATSGALRFMQKQHPPTVR